MNWFYYLNYRIFKYYQRKKESIPTLYSILGTAMLLFMNIYSSLLLVEIFKPIPFLEDKKFVLILFMILVLLIYLILYRKSQYISIFENFDKTCEKNDVRKRYISIYIMSTIVILLALLGIADFRYDGHL